MKKILLGTSALIGVAAAGPAFAQSAGGEPIKLNISGHWLGAYGDILGGGDSMVHIRRDDLQFDNTVHFTGSTKLDNGLTVGVVFQFRAENLAPSVAATQGVEAGGAAVAGSDRVKRQWVSFSGGFGDVRVGDQDDVRRQRAVTAPVAGGGTLFGANSPQFTMNPAAATNTTQRSISTTSRVSRIVYLSPTIAGFSLGASYTPGGEKGGQAFGNGGTGAPSQGANIVNNEVSLSGTYSGKFGDISLSAATAVSQGHRVRVDQTQTGHFNPFAVDAGFNVGFGPITVGAAYEFVRDPAAVTIGSQHKENQTWDLGALYEIGPFGVGLDWTRGIYTSGAHNNIGNRLDAISLSTDYKLGPGISVGAAIDYTHQNLDFGTGNFNSMAILVATGLFF